MKKIQRSICLLAAFVMAQGALADDPSETIGYPFRAIQAQLDRLDARTQALEASAPSSDIEGRTYCSMLELTVMRGKSIDETEELQTHIIRRTATFSGGTFTGAYISNVLNNQTDVGVVEHPAGQIIDPLLATYMQTGSKLDVTFAQGPAATWYVSKDGSLIHGTKIEHLVVGGGRATVGFLRSWTLLETDPLDTCNTEVQ